MKAYSANVLRKAALLLLLAGSTSSALANIGVREVTSGNFNGAVRGTDDVTLVQARCGENDTCIFASSARKEGFGSNASPSGKVDTHLPQPPLWTLLVTGLGLVSFALMRREPVKVLNTTN